MPDVLDAATQAMMADVCGSVNRNELVLPGRFETILTFPPGTLVCWDIEWIPGSEIMGQCWYDPDGFDLEAVCPLARLSVMVRRRAHFPDHVLWRVDLAPHDRYAQMRMFRLPDATLPICPDDVGSMIPTRAPNESREHDDKRSNGC